jgi:hypothetical protein
VACKPHPCCLHLILRCLIVLALISGTTLTAFSTQFWENKDWTTWSETQCREILFDTALNSPWAQVSGSTMSGGSFSYTDRTWVQFRSALPVRQALARLDEINSGYDKMSPAQRQLFDQKTKADLNENYADRVVLHIKFSTFEGGKRPAQANQTAPSQVTLFLPDGKQLTSSPPESVRSTTNEVEYDVAFPRIVDGQSLLKPGDKKFKVWDIEFDASKMFFHGKLEY